MTKPETKLLQLRAKKYSLDKQQLKLAEEIRYEEMLTIEKGLMPPYPFDFLCFEVTSYNEIIDKTVNRIQRRQCWQNNGYIWEFFDGSDFLFWTNDKGEKNLGRNTFFNLEEAEQYAAKADQRRKEEAEKEKQKKITEAKKILEQAENETK